MQSKVTIFCESLEAIKDLVSGAQLFSNDGYSSYVKIEELLQCDW